MKTVEINGVHLTFAEATKAMSWIGYRTTKDWGAYTRSIAEIENEQQKHDPRMKQPVSIPTPQYVLDAETAYQARRRERSALAQGAYIFDAKPYL